MENKEKDRVEKAVKSAFEDSFEQIRDILDKYNVVLRNHDFDQISQDVLRMIQLKID